MKTKPLVSIIIPVYNVLSYLKQCLDSVKGQSYSNWECIIVDDGSTDGSAEYLDEYTKGDTRFRVIHKQNAGLAAARQSGLLLASGKYVIHIDSDDYVENNHVLLMTECAENEQADIVLTDYYIDLSGKQELVHQKPISLDKKRLICDALEARHHAGLWCKIFRREVIARNAIPPAPYSYYEDMFSYFSFLQYATNIVYSPCATYHYRYNQQSMTNSIDVPMRISTYEQCMKNLEELVRICKFSDDEEIMKALYDRVNGEKIRLFIFCSQHYQFLKSSLMSYFPQSFTTLQPHTINERIVYLTIKGKVIFQHLYMLWYRLCRKLLLKQKI